MLLKAIAAVSLLAQAALGAPAQQVTERSGSDLGFPEKRDVAATASGYKNMVYYANWDMYEPLNFMPQQLNVKYMTHVIYAFADIDSNGNVISSDPWADYGRLLAGDELESGNNAYGNIKQLYILKKKNRGLKTLLSIGGFARSQEGIFKAAVSSEAARKRFAKSAVGLVANWGFDGIDIDWEYPNWLAEGEQFYQLIKETRAALDQYAKDVGHKYHYILSVATSAGPDKYSKLPLSKINNRVDTIQLMTYDYAGDWDATTGHASNVHPDKTNPAATKFNTNKAVTDYIAKGVNSKKILLGMPLYGRSFANTNGLGKSYSGTGKGSYEKGIWLFKDLPRPNAKVMTRTDLAATYTYDSKTTEYVTLDGRDSTKLKANYLKSKGLGGAFFWEAMGDKTGTSSLVRTMAESMGGLDRSQNQLDYPNSEFDNIKNGMPGV